jgi:hypothetical protein
MMGGSRIHKKQKGRGGIQDYIADLFTPTSSNKNMSNKVNKSNNKDEVRKAYEEGIRQGIQMTLHQMKDIQDLLANQYARSLNPVKITMKSLSSNKK